MKKLIIVFGIAVLLCGGAGPASAGVVYDFDGDFYGYVESFGFSIPLNGWTVGQHGQMGELTFVDGFVPTPGGSFTTADVADFIILNPDGSVFLPYFETVSISGTFGTDLTNGYPEIETFFWDKTTATGGNSELLLSNIFMCYETPMGVIQYVQNSVVYAEPGQAPVPPEASFTTSPAPPEGMIPLTVVFTDTSQNAVSWEWNFGDPASGADNTSTDQNPEHTYTEAGTYTATLTATGEGGSDTATATIRAMQPQGPPTAGFSAAPLTGKAPLTVKFTDLSTEGGTWLWDFGDGDTSSSQSPSHTYAEPGVYTVTQTVQNAAGEDTETKTNYIEAIGTLYLYYPCIIASDTWTTEAGLINTNSQGALTGTLTWYNNAGAQVGSTPVNLAPNARQELAFGPQNSDVAYLMLETERSGARGYARYSVNEESRASLPAVDRASSGDLYLHHVVSNDTWESRIVLLNTTDSPKNLILEFQGAVGKAFPIEAHSQRVTTINELFNGYRPVDIRSGIVRGGAGIIGIELFEAAHEMFGVMLQDSLATTIYYPHVVSNQRWETGVVFFKPSSTLSDVTVTSYQADGTEAGSTVVPLGSYEKFARCWKQTDLVDSAAAWCKVECAEPLTGFEAFFNLDHDQSAAFNTTDITKKNGVLAMHEQDGWTGIGMLNVGGADAAVTLTAYDDGGTMVAEELITIAPGAKKVSTVEQLFTADISAATYITYSSNEDIIAFELNDAADTMLDALPAL